ncbi:GNAT family N-acetyltransferase [Luteipulveratus flavus]|uniref:GNAT family N-acetyltransferase n=2 Tax=Luteipulveratus flavus TaxID=3031728 RepID=A0ABT6C8V3_9MICO|nr:GNAT family N-acetyltransferase [Luteipulveratus sp. YIM 133296]MDF8265351.1 GNAT family N-acetyltransferase [Luteipulveratus sp. YIM 133296]
MSGEESGSGTATERSVVVRQADGDDLTAVVEVGHRTWPVTYGPIAGDDYVAMGLAKWWTQEATIPAIRAGRVLVAEVDGEIVGMASVGPSEGHLILWKLYVLPSHQRDGLGARLLRAVIDKAQEDGYDELRLSYLAGNDGAGAFYEHFGFRETERESGGSGIPDSVWMARPLRTDEQEERQS